MAVRHEVENLIRRGHIFYWRPRVPAAFINCRPGSRLSRSLHCSDHKKAQIIGDAVMHSRNSTAPRPTATTDNAATQNRRSELKAG